MLLYRILSILLFPFIELYLIFRVIKKKEDKKRLKERFGHSTEPRPQGEVIWIHAVSVGEVNSALILLDELLKFSPDISILFTTTTLTSASIVAAKIPDFQGRVIHQFLPVDSYFCVKNFFNFWQPRTAIFVESEIWPNLILEAHSRGISIFLINARMSEKSFSNWRFAKKFGFKIFDYFSQIFAQTKDDQNRFKQLTDQEILFYGNLKAQAQDLDFDIKKLEALKSQIGSRKLWLAASTHAGEEEVIIQIHQQLKKEFSDLLTIIIPRHPNRAEEIKRLFGEIKFAQRSANEKITKAKEIYLADSLNELGIFYRLSPFAFIGGSLTATGGHNPFEAVKLGCAVISGREVFNFKEIYEKLAEQKACVMVDSSEQLFFTVKRFLENDDECKALSARALKLIKNPDNIAKKIVTRIDQVLMIGV